MGQSLPNFSRRMTKLVALLCFVAFTAAEPDADASPVADAKPEADPWYYGSYGYGGLHGGYGAYGYGGLGGHYGHGYLLGYGKRSADAAPVADAKAEADPWYLYSGLHHGYGYGGLGYGSLYGHYGNGYLLGYGKRSADAAPVADAKAEADPWYLYSGLHHGYGYGGLGYGRLYGHYGN